MNGNERTVNGEFLAAVLAATPDRIASAMRILTGEAELAAADDRPLLMTVTDAAKRLGVARNTLGRAIRAGRLKKIEIYEGSSRLRRADVEALALGMRR